jgi:flagellar basal-body rod protein FlgB
MATFTHQVITHNIANANSPGFVPLRARFDGMLARAGADLQSGLGGAYAEPDPQVAPGASAVSQLDTQIAKMNENMVRYQMLLRGVNQRINLIDMALNDGRR